MKKLKSILDERDIKIQLIKHRTNDAINNFWTEIDKRKIITDLGWVYIHVSLASDLISFNLEHISNNYKYTLSASSKITTILAKNFTKDNVHFIQSYPQIINKSNNTESKSIILDPQIWVNMKNMLYQVIDEYIGFTNT